MDFCKCGNELKDNNKKCYTCLAKRELCRCTWPAAILMDIFDLIYFKLKKKSNI